MVLLLTPGALIAPHASPKETGEVASREQPRNSISSLRSHPRLFLAATMLAGIAPLFGFTAIALGLVGYVTSLFKLSSILTILWARWVLGEGHLPERLLGASVMSP